VNGNEDELFVDEGAGKIDEYYMRMKMVVGARCYVCCEDECFERF